MSVGESREFFSRKKSGDRSLTITTVQFEDEGWATLKLKYSKHKLVNIVAHPTTDEGDMIKPVEQYKAMVTTPAKQISLEEFLQLPETKPASEYIDGKIIQTVLI